MRLGFKHWIWGDERVYYESPGIWISVLYFFWYSVHGYSLLGNLWWGFQKMVTKMFICNMSYSVKKKKRNLFIPLPLEHIECARPRVQDAQFDTILTEIKACFNLWSMHALSRLVASILEMPHQGGGPVKLDSMWQHRLTRPLHVQHTYYRIIFKQNPFNIISRGVQRWTSTDFRLK